MRRLTPALALIALTGVPATAWAHEDTTTAPTAPAKTPAAEMPATADRTEPRASRKRMAVRLSATADAMSGWNLHVRATGFTWTPRQASTAAKQGGGHAHVYVDGEKVGRLYGPWMQLPALSPGKHEITVSLNANDHRPWSWKGAEVKTSVSVMQMASMPMAPMRPHADLPSDRPMSLKLTVRKDAMSGYNGFVTTSGLRLTPWAANSAPVAGAGHMHLYVDGEKIGRLYTRAFHLPTLSPGKHQVTVSANANDHSPWAWNGTDVDSTRTVVVPKS